ncbi:glutamine amidotransferase [Zoogloea sp.]|uniref:glutamine amidotransferase n=1 Tax=Zoogloea sp. TaxID=49181 RepID=UPI0035AF195D
MPPLLIVKLGDYTPVLAARPGDFESWISAGLGDVPVRVVDPRCGEALPAACEVAAVVVTGSPSMVTDREAWSEATARWLARRVAEGVPVLGICYGHQLLAHALGGEAAWHPKGMEIGTVSVRKSAAAWDDPLFADLPEVFPAHVVHSQTARRLPPGAECLASSDFEPHHAFRVGEAAWGVQFHPEFDAVAMKSYIAQLSGALRKGGADPDQLAAAVTETHAATSVLRRFARFVAERAAQRQDAAAPAPQP